MTRLTRDTVVEVALDLLDELGLDAISTRQLAKRLDIEQPSLYWHFRKKEDLLAAMAEAAMRPHGQAPLPQPGDDWRQWYVENYRSFRRTLLLRRDGARLHAGSLPGGFDLERIRHKFDFLVDAGVPEHDAKMAMFAGGRFTVGAALEEQAATELPAIAGLPSIDPVVAFEEGLALIVAGLTSRLGV
jgi:TetR/AcrR family tetracycline transcriptional repressor